MFTKNLFATENAAVSNVRFSVPHTVLSYVKSTVFGKDKDMAERSCGWNVGGQTNVTLTDGSTVRCQLTGCNIIAVKSREWDAERKSPFANGLSGSFAIDSAVLGVKPMLFGKDKDMSERSCGWNVAGKINVTLSDGSTVQCQLSGNLVVVKSKEWADSPNTTAVKPSVAANSVVEQPKPIAPVQTGWYV